MVAKTVPYGREAKRDASVAAGTIRVEILKANSRQAGCSSVRDPCRLCKVR
jgi:hypothetical protein